MLTSRFLDYHRNSNVLLPAPLRLHRKREITLQVPSLKRVYRLVIDPRQLCLGDTEYVVPWRMGYDLGVGCVGRDGGFGSGK